MQPALDDLRKAATAKSALNSSAAVSSLQCHRADTFSLPTPRILEPAHSSVHFTQQPPETGTIPAHSSLLGHMTVSPASPSTSRSCVPVSPASAQPRPTKAITSPHLTRNRALAPDTQETLTTSQNSPGVMWGFGNQCTYHARSQLRQAAGGEQDPCPQGPCRPQPGADAAEGSSRAVGASSRGHRPQCSLVRSFSFLS